jgi:hypothetical protein
MNRLMVPPLPAASRPSNKRISRSPVALTQYWSFSSSICGRRLVRSLVLAPHPLGIGIALPPGSHRPTVGSYEYRLVVIAVVHAQVGQLVQQVAGLDRGGDIDDLVVSAHPWSVAV